MSDGYLISVGVKADFSSLKAEQKSAQDEVKRATENMAAAYAEFGKAAEQGSAQATAALKQYESELAAAQARAVTASEAISSVGAAASHTVPQVAAASGAIRLFEGALPIRAVERFAVTTLGLGPILQAAFPIIGAVALAEMLIHIAEGFEKTGEKARESEQKVRDLDTQYKAMAADLRVQIDKEDEARAKIEKVPFNGMKLALDEAAKSAITLYQRIDGIIKREADMVKDMGGGMLSHIVGRFGTNEEQTMLAEHNRHLGEQRDIQGQINEETSYGTSLQTRLTELKGKQAIADQQRVEAAKTGAGGLFLPDYSKEIAAIQQMIEWQKQELDVVKLTKDEETNRPPVNNGGAENAAKRAAELAKKEHSEVVAAMIKGDQIEASERERLDREVREHEMQLDRQAEEQRRIADRAEDERLRDSKREYEEQLRLTEEITRAKLADAESSINQQMGNVRAQGAEGMIGPSQEAAQLRDLVQQKVQIENEYYRQLEALYLQDSVKWQGIENQRLAAMRKNADDMVKITENAERRQARTYQQLAQTINRELLSAMNGILSGQVSVGRGAEQMASRMVLSFANAMAQDVLRHAEAKEIQFAHEAAHWIKVNVLRMSDAASAQATDATANATKLTETIATNIAAAASNAAVAATGAYAATAMIPIVGPELAPGVAAATYAGAMGFGALASASGGWGTVPNDTLALIHKNEMVLPASYAHGLRSMLSGGGGGRSAPFTYAPTINGAGNTREIQKTVRQSPRDVAKAFQRAVRNGHI